MPRNVFYRDFTICKAIALIALIAVAAMIDEVPRQAPALAQAGQAQVIPAMIHEVWTGCDDAKMGINL